MTDHHVVIVGAGPTGLMLAGELALSGAHVIVLERRTDHTLVGSRAAGMTPRTIEVLDQRGIVDRFLTEGRIIDVGPGFSALTMDLRGLPTRHSYVLGLLQYRVERILADWVAELGVTIRYGCEVVGVSQDSDGVDVTLTDGTSLRGAYAVGCDGGRSTIRKSTGIAFPGWEPSTSCLVADVEMTDEPPWGMHRDGGHHSFFKFDGEDTIRVTVTEPDIGNTGQPALADISAALRYVRGTDYGLHRATWISRFTDTTRQAATYRDRRVLLAGDAAHIHFPIGGQGLNTGIQDAVNLGWKLGHVVTGTSGPQLLDTYHAERHPVGARVLHTTMAQTALNSPGARTDALRDIMTDILAMDEPRARIAALMSGLDIRYDLGDESPLVGRRAPDLDLDTAEDGRTRLFTLLHQGHGILLTSGLSPAADMTPWADRVRTIAACPTQTWCLPVLGEVPAPRTALIRPDGYIAWTDNSTPQLHLALNRWFA
jgi:2-polyprenyl-6-methoxyphenol hydroxylase-like FAD-dependent oxidoreductase